jgi:positive regulator of sigma E activity
VSPRGRQQQDDDDELDLLRYAAIVVFIILSVLVVGADILGRLFKDGGFRVDAVVMGLVFGTLLSLLGLEGVQRLLRKDDDEKP